MMHRISHLIAILLFAGLSIPTYSQIEKTLQFIPEEVDFGDIRESGGPVTKIVKAVNISGQPTSIVSARTSCGCSSAEFDSSTIAPGDTVDVKITYDPHNRPGRFLKTAKFFTGSERISNFIHFKGNVIPSWRHLVKVFPDTAGNLRLSTKLVSVGEMRRVDSRPVNVEIYNDSSRPVNLAVDTDSDALEAALKPCQLAPYGVALLSMKVRGRHVRDDVADFSYNATISDSDTGQTIVVIPVGGAIKTSNP